jgi:urease accessory protein
MTRVLEDRRSAREIGRAARLELCFAVRDGRTVLTSSYAEPPFRIGKCLDRAALNDREQPSGVELVIASSAPGVFGGDRLEQIVRVEPGAHARLTSQSSLQMHPDPEGRTAEISSRFEVASGGSLSCGWHPFIPFKDANVDQRIAIDVAAGGRLWWSDGVTSGREARGERWRFARLAHELRLTRGDALTYLERYVIEPDAQPVTAPWIADDSCYFGTAIAVAPEIDRAFVEGCHDALQTIDAARSSADLLEPEVMLVRVMTSAGVPFHAARELLGRYAPV